MKRYISNYTILSNGDVFINHITTVSDEDALISIEPFDRELGNTIYVPVPLCVTDSTSLEQVVQAFLEASSREQFMALHKAAGVEAAHKGDEVAVLKLNFARKTTTKL